jgi:glycogen operon protein
MPGKGIEPGRAAPLGATLDNTGVNFALFSANAESVELCLFDHSGAREVARIELPSRTGDVWHGHVAGLTLGQRYGYRVYGPYEPRKGHRFNPNKLLIDPYARRIDRSFALDDRHFAYRLGDPDGDLSFDGRDSADVTPKSIVTGVPAAPMTTPPGVPWQDTIIYELHARGFTMRREDIPAQWRGTLKGLASRPVIGYLRELGINAVELMPINPIGDERHLKTLGLRNYWGYNPINFFAVEPRYAAENPAQEFQALVEALHRTDIELILDVVFNHTAEGDALGPTISLRGIDNASYYSLMPDNPQVYVNNTGVGNTLNVEHRCVRDLVLDALRFWARQGVDGFRFDLTSALARSTIDCRPETGLIAEIGADPELSQLKLIAEPWDASPDGYRLGSFPRPWREWNDRFRNCARRFWRGDKGQAGEFASRFAGSSDIMANKGPLASINFVTAHDGFTLADLVSYERKHNWANGEHNADGVNENYSRNWGVEGQTDDPAVVALRERHRRNFVATLMISQGVPMLLAGDELGRTQKGNNNAYCQDNDTSWIQWGTLDQEAEAFRRFVQRAIDLKRKYRDFSRSTFFSGKPEADGFRDIVWQYFDGREMSDGDWRNPDLAAFGCLFGACDRFLCFFNGGPEDVTLVAPSQRGRWKCMLDSTSKDGGRDGWLAPDARWAAPAHSLLLFKHEPT